MKHLLSLVFLFLVMPGIRGQTDTVAYHQRLYYTCKVWGYAKFYHRNIAEGQVPWDDALLTTLDKVKSAGSDEEFNQVLQAMLELAGTPGTPVGTCPELPDILIRNIDLAWFQDPMILPGLRGRLQKIEQDFRPWHHSLLSEGQGWEISYEKDSAYYGTGDYPGENLRLLGLFRYWNTINYFFPYKYMMDQDWDSTLTEFIPAFIQAGNALRYHLTFVELTTRINDSHAFYRSPVYDALKGNSHAPFLARNIEDKLVITKVLPEFPDLHPGDIILEIDQRKVAVLLDSVRKYSAGSNPSVIESYAYEALLYGADEDFQVLVDHGDRTVTYTCRRDQENYTLLTAPSEKMWRDKTTTNGVKVRIVDMGNLTNDEVEDLFTRKSKIGAYIFDLRKKPQGTIQDIADQLFLRPVPHCNLQVPDPDYPGSFFWYYATIGGRIAEAYDGRVLLLVDEHSRSHTEFSCMALEQFPGSMTFGYTTAGADGNITWIYVPGRAYTAFSNIGVFYPDNREVQRVGIVPDVMVRPTIEGIRAGRDEVLEAALQYLGDEAASDREMTIDRLRVYPNPAGNTLCYSCRPGSREPLRLAIIDLRGKLIREFTGIPCTGELSLEGIDPGIYILSIQNQFNTLFVKN